MKRYSEFIKESNETHDSEAESSWIYEGNFRVTEDMVHNGEMIKEKIPDIVNGEFDCSYLKLITLKNCPKKVGKNFLCNSNRLKNLEFCPEKIDGDIECRSNRLTSLEGCPKEIGGSFFCSNNRLKTLEFGPEIINGRFNCVSNKLKSLEFAPKKGISNNIIGGMYLDISVNNNLYDLEIEKQFIAKGYTEYWPDLLKYCIDDDIELTEVKGWPKGFLKSNTAQSVKGISKFDL